jgi:LmeA-like phospholipid-binding
MRALRITLITLLVLGGLFVGADRLALKLAEDRTAEEIKSSQNVRDVSVSFGGFPFLTQLAARNLDSFEARLSGVTATTGQGGLRVDELDIRARGLRLASDYRPTVAERATGTVRLSYQALSEATGENVRVEYGGEAEGGESKVKVRVPVLEHPITSTVSVRGGDTIRLRADTVPGSGTADLENRIRGRIDYTRRIDELPDGVRMEEIEATRRGVDVRFSGTNVGVTP